MTAQNLDSICQMVTDGTHYTPKDVRIGIPFLTVKDMSPEGLDFSGCSHISESEFKTAKEGNSAPQQGDVLFSKDGTVGKVHVVSDDRDFAVLSSIAILRPDPRKVDSKYLGQMLRTPKVLEQAMDRKTGSAIRRIILSDLRKVRIPLPLLEEQRRIAAILDQAETLRAKRRQALAKLETLERAIFHKFFESSNEKRSWNLSGIEAIADFKTGFPFLSSEYVEDGVRLCRGANVLPKRIDWSDSVFLDAKRKSDFAEYHLATGDIVVAMDRPWISEGFKVAQITSEAEGSLLVQRVARLRPRQRSFGSFLYSMLVGPAFTRHCKPTETTVPHISPTDFRQFRFPLPPQGLIERFDEVISKLRDLHNQGTKSLDKLDRNFLSLQHRAFRGEL